MSEDLSALRVKADHQKDPEAQYRLGLMYEEGRGVPQHYVAANRYYQMACKQGQADAWYRLGLMYEEGRGVSRDCVTARTIYTKVALRGHAEAQYRLGLLHYQGWQGVIDAGEAYVWLTLAAAGGVKQAADARDRAATDLSKEMLLQAQRKAVEISSGYRKR